MPSSPTVRRVEIPTFLYAALDSEAVACHASPQSLARALLAVGVAAIRRSRYGADDPVAGMLVSDAACYSAAWSHLREWGVVEDHREGGQLRGWGVVTVDTRGTNGG